MKHSEHTTSSPLLTTLSDVICWREALQQWHARLACHFARPQPCARAMRFVEGILSTVERKNGWQLAEQAREATPYGMQRLLSQAVWDADGVRDEIRRFTLHHLGRHPVIIAIDETGFLKRGKHSAGVAKQYYGPSGDVRNCQVGVFLSLVTAASHCLIDRELYVPREWLDDAARCLQAAIPQTTPFRTKPELAILMLQRLLQTQLEVQWVVADSVYGGNGELRRWLETHQLPYVMAIACDEPVVVELPQVGVRRLEVRDLPAQLAPSDWQPLSMSQGTKGPRLFEWACLPIWHQGCDDGCHSVLLRRPLDPSEALTYSLVFSSPAASLQAKVAAQGARWQIEEDFENGKDLGLDHYEVRSFVGWYRHITLVMLALAFLTSIALTSRSPSPALLLASSSDAPAASSCELCPLSVPEVRRLLARLLFPPTSSPPLVFAWSWWRRRHQQHARLLHTRRRTKAG